MCHMPSLADWAAIHSELPASRPFSSLGYSLGVFLRRVRCLATAHGYERTVVVSQLACCQLEMLRIELGDDSLPFLPMRLLTMHRFAPARLGFSFALLVERKGTCGRVADVMLVADDVIGIVVLWILLDSLLDDADRFLLGVCLDGANGALDAGGDDLDVVLHDRSPSLAGVLLFLIDIISCRALAESYNCC